MPCIVAKVLHQKVTKLSPQMSWPPKSDDLLPNKISRYIPRLLDVFYQVLLSGENVDGDRSGSQRVLRLKNSLCQDIVYCASNGKIKTPKSVLFPAVVKSLCNNTEVIKCINQYGHGIGYNLIEEVETEYALQIINQQTEKRVIIPDEVLKEGNNSCISLMIADNIDNLESTLTGAGTSHRVNSILVTKRKAAELGVDDTEEGELPVKRKCHRTLPEDVISREIPEYYGGKRVGPGELQHVKDLHTSTNYAERSDIQRKKYLIWLEVRKIKTHPALLVPGWTV